MRSVLLVLAFLLSPILVKAQSQPPPPPSSIAPETNKTPEPAKPAPSKNAIALPPEKSKPVQVARFDAAPVIDGRLDDEVWKKAAVLKDFYQINPGDNIAPSKPVEVLIGYDSKTLYIAFRAPDEAGKVRATVAKRDSIWDDDNVGMFIDTFNDKRKAYALFFNPLGVQADGILTEGVNEDYSLDIVMESKGVVTEDGYTVEIAIPFKSLRYEAGKGKLWGAHFFRRIKRFNNELNSWMPISRDRSGTLNQEGHLTGFEGIAVERSLEIIPTLTLSESGRRVRTLPLTTSLTDPGRFVNNPLKADPGVSVKLGVTPTVTLDFAANPDFAQVEADQPVVTANQRFPIFFAEKRPFFLEGIDIFQTPINVVHTRTIIDPDFAVKLTGKQGRNTFGLLLASDNAPGDFSEEERNDPELLPTVEKFGGKNAYVGVLRLKRDVGKEGSLGMVATSYNFIEKHNQVVGFDGRFRLDQKTTAAFQVLGTASRRSFFDPDLDDSLYRTGNGFGYSWNIDYTGRNFGYFIYGEGRTRDYRADVGFTRRVNTNFQDVAWRVSTDPKPKARLIFWRLVNSTRTNYDWDGRLQQLTNESSIGFSLQRQLFYGIGYSLNKERIFEDEFGARRGGTRAGAFAGHSERSTFRKTFYTFLEGEPSKRYAFNMFFAYSMDAFDFDFGGGRRFPRVSRAALIDPDSPLDPGPGNNFEANLSFLYKPTEALRASLDYTKSRLVREDTGLTSFDDNIFSLRTTYQFTRFTFLRARLDYSTLASSVRGQYLFGWTPNPGTSFYLGYNDDLNFNGFSPFTDHLEPGFRRNTRTFFIKTSYLIRRSI
jgi:hypothetical protein